MQVSGRVVQLVCKGEVEPRHQAQGRKELDDGSKIPVLSWDFCFRFGQGSTSPVLEKHDGVTWSIVAHLIRAKGVDFSQL